MTILVTIGPTQEPLDAMRILSNRSTGNLGTSLSVAFAKKGHRVIALRGIGATAETHELVRLGATIVPFTTTEELRSLFEKISKTESINAVFHAAAVSDFYFPDSGNGKIPTSLGSLTLTLQPTPKLLPLLREWFPEAVIIGWKFEAAGNRDEYLAIARNQIVKNRTDGCVLNGPAYGEGFGFVKKEGELHHLSDSDSLCCFLGDLEKSF